MGDAAHRRRRSAHNDGNALDVTNDPRNGPPLGALVEDLARQMRANPSGGRLAVLIFDRRIWTGPSWQPRRYFGLNPHRSHAHIEVKATHRSLTRSWTLLGRP